MRNEPVFDKERAPARRAHLTRKRVHHTRNAHLYSQTDEHCVRSVPLAKIGESGWMHCASLEKKDASCAECAICKNGCALCAEQAFVNDASGAPRAQLAQLDECIALGPPVSGARPLVKSGCIVRGEMVASRMQCVLKENGFMDASGARSYKKMDALCVRSAP